ncbi:hypothetical protein SEVIR_4G038300v4 [Setaria viridis]|uniref:Uncharacterized protein n=1 Tax=Setaria viridis TaxID=4556 RepID=A0A4U6UY23_SETVI|nr:proteoglycan 4-like [Setaria viridis]TKW19713.1 hypothetical protein SEVIR_4G038300v2 [Setaria viridis]
MSSRAAATAAAPRGAEGAAGMTDHLWAKAAELERDFAGYKRRLAERRAQTAAEVAGGRAEDAEEERRGGDDAAAGRGRRYEEYVRRRDERLRQEWRARMERKEAEMQALWARLDRAGSRGRRGGELAAASSNAGEDHGNLRQKPGNLEVKVRPTAPVTPRCSVPSSPATKLSRPRTSVPSSPAAAASPRLSTPDPRRRPSHLHREQPQAAEPPATPRKENRLPPSTATAASPATPRPRTMLSRSRSLFKDRGSSAATARESLRPPQLQPPRLSYDSASNAREPAPLPPHADAIAVTRSNSCSNSNGQAVLADLKKASAVAPEPFRLGRSGNGSVETVSPPQVIPRDEPDSSEAAPARDGNADNESNHEHVDQPSNKVGSVEITGDSDTEPSYVYIKKDTGEQTPRPCQASAGLGTCPGAEEPRSDSKDSDDNADDTMESTGSNDVAGETPVTDAEDASRRESSESLYSNVQSSFSPRSELDTSAADSPLPSATEQSPESYASPRPRMKPEVEGAEKSMPIPTTPRSSVTVSITVQSPMDAVTGLKRFLSFGKKNGKGNEAPTAAVVERTPRSMAPSTPPGDGCMSGEWSAGDSVKGRLDSSDVASADDLDNSYLISPHVRSLQSYVPSYPANPGLKEPALHAQSPRAHRSFFSFSSFKSRAI